MGRGRSPAQATAPRSTSSSSSTHKKFASRSPSVSSISTNAGDLSLEGCDLLPNKILEKQSEVTGSGGTAIHQSTCEEVSPKSSTRKCAKSGGKKISTVVSLGVTHSEVYLHVYDLHPLTRMAGLPLYHTGVEVHDCECSFGSEGLQWVRPGCVPHEKEVVPLGPTHLTAKQVIELAAQLSEEWRGCDYHLLNHNCQTFSVEFCRRLGVPKSVPEEFVRFAKWK